MSMNQESVAQKASYIRARVLEGGASGHVVSWLKPFPRASKHQRAP